MKRSTTAGWIAGVSLLAVSVGLAAKTRGFRVQLPSGWSIQPAAEATHIGDLAAGGTVSPDRRWTAFVTAGQAAHRLVLVDSASGDVRSQTEIGGLAWIGLDWAADSRSLLVSGGNSNSLHLVSVSPEGTARVEKTLPIADLQRNAGWLAGLAQHQGLAYVAASGADRVLKVSLADGKVLATRQFDEGAAPYQVRRAGDGTLVVSLQGAEAVAVLEPESL